MMAKVAYCAWEIYRVISEDLGTLTEVRKRLEEDEMAGSILRLGIFILCSTSHGSQSNPSSFGHKYELLEHLLYNYSRPRYPRRVLYLLLGTRSHNLRRSNSPRLRLPRTLDASRSLHTSRPWCDEADELKLASRISTTLTKLNAAQFPSSAPTHDQPSYPSYSKRLPNTKPLQPGTQSPSAFHHLSPEPQSSFKDSARPSPRQLHNLRSTDEEAKAEAAARKSSEETRKTIRSACVPIRDSWHTVIHVFYCRVCARNHVLTRQDIIAQAAAPIKRAFRR